MTTPVTLVAFLSALALFLSSCDGTGNGSRRVSRRAGDSYLDSIITATQSALEHDSTNADLHLQLAGAILAQVDARQNILRSVGSGQFGIKLSLLNVGSSQFQDQIHIVALHLVKSLNSTKNHRAALMCMGQVYLLKSDPLYIWQDSLFIMEQDSMQRALQHGVDTSLAQLQSIQWALGYYPTIALQYFQEALGQGADSSQTFLFMSRCYSHNRKARMAEQSVREAIRVDPRNGLLYKTLGDIQLRQGMREESFASFHRAIGLGLDDPEAYLDLADYYLDPLVDEELVGTFHKAIQNTPSFAKSIVDFGFSYFRKSRFDVALNLCKSAYVLDSSSSIALVGQALCHSYKGDNAEAARLYCQALDLPVKDEEQLYITKLDLLEAVRTRRPNNDRVLSILGSAYYSSDRFVDALKTYKEWTAIRTEAGEPHFYVGRSYENLGDTVNAFAAYDEALNLPIVHSAIYWEISKSYLNGRRPDKAVMATATSIRVSKDALHREIIKDLQRKGHPLDMIAVPVAQCDIARQIEVYHGVKNPFLFHNAVELLSNATTVLPDFALAYGELGEVYLVNGDSTSAIRYYKRAASLGDKGAKTILTTLEARRRAKRPV
jgi:tetratricopeptide (TPR) repeat protein